MRKWIAAATIVVVAGVSLSGTALAGEVTGRGRGGPNGDGNTPIASYQAGSICSFSGQNDDPTGGGDPFQDGRVQNWGKVVEDAKVFIGDGDHGINELAHDIRVEGPGTNCRGYASTGG